MALQYQTKNTRDAGVYGSSKFTSAPPSDYTHTSHTYEKALVQPTTNTVPTFLWDKDPDLDDALHTPDARGRDSSPFTLFSARGWFNAGALVILVIGLIILFAGYPVIHYYTTHTAKISGYNIGGINASGQVQHTPLHSLDKPNQDLFRSDSGNSRGLWAHRHRHTQRGLHQAVLEGSICADAARIFRRV